MTGMEMETWRVGVIEMVEGDYGYTASSPLFILNWISKAMAKSYVRHKNKEIARLGIKDRFYFAEDVDDMEPDLSHWI